MTAGNSPRPVSDLPPGTNPRARRPDIELFSVMLLRHELIGAGHALAQKGKYPA